MLDINNLTLGQLKELQALAIGLDASPTSSKLYADLPGQKVIVRTRNEGVNFGEIVVADETGVVLKNARRLHYMDKAANGGSWYEAIANEGVGGKTRMSQPALKKVIVEDYSITLCTPDAVKSLENWKNHEG